MKYIENIVIGKPLVEPFELLGLNQEDYIQNEEEKTYFTEERRLSKILVNIGVVKSISEVRRNKPQYDVTLDKVDFLEIKWGKRKMWVIVGE